ncbi:MULTISPECIES: hypothetical protein [unclassified Curtobacterium]|uniref:hypothetical protein n=1 Tax=unclassified Curtobacterium TaxID=257496 RepID=UPI000D8A44A2|nr:MULTISPECIES: hypothetical protein [unclassified Curtobacterium]PYY65718.1 hypothetical protein DEJ30_01235 [Curtobacterium sp. MCPF17_003]PZE73100.1 hypothetical protein DEJ27_01185 [Curtobacterium sp. MCPF17_018]WIB71188.1 hypothetical protein DEI85_01920 [Curtobacterium sp. MCBD17_026]
MTVTTRPPLASTRSSQRRAIIRVPQIAAWGTLKGLSEVIRFTGFMTILAAMGVDAGARSVINR